MRKFLRINDEIIKGGNLTCAASSYDLLFERGMTILNA